MGPIPSSEQDHLEGPVENRLAGPPYGAEYPLRAVGAEVAVREAAVRSGGRAGRELMKSTRPPVAKRADRKKGDGGGELPGNQEGGCGTLRLYFFALPGTFSALSAYIRAPRGWLVARIRRVWRGAFRALAPRSSVESSQRRAAGAVTSSGADLSPWKYGLAHNGSFAIEDTPIYRALRLRRRE